MAKKMLISFAIIFLSLCCSVCFAADNNANVNLGDQITDSLDKAGNGVRNVTSDVMDAGANTMRSVGNTIDGNNNNNTNNDNRMSQRNTTNDTNYNAIRTSVDENYTNGTMSTTTWIWIILAVAAIVIVAMVWYYAVKNEND